MILENLRKAVNEYSALVFTFTILIIILFVCILFDINIAAQVIVAVCAVLVFFVMRSKRKLLNNSANAFANYYKIQERKIKRSDIRVLLQLFAQKNINEKELEIQVKKILRG